MATSLASPQLFRIDLTSFEFEAAIDDGVDEMIWNRVQANHRKVRQRLYLCQNWRSDDYKRRVC